MPYIKQDVRDELDAGGLPLNSGELNYRITKLLANYFNQNGLSYSSINDAIGALEGAKLELYRRIAVPYENSKLAENGDVYDNG